MSTPRSQLSAFGVTSSNANSLVNFYKSLPLPKHTQSIRVLDLEGFTQGQYDGGAQQPYGRLRVVDLAQNPSFTALSYVWGTYSTPRDTILCGSTRLEVTKHCYDALNSLHRQYGPITIWIDVVCINQRDDTERGEQILLMEKIYAWAMTVYIWLGNGTLNSERAMDCILSAPVNWIYLIGTTWVAAPRSSRSLKREGWETFRKCFKAIIGGEKSPLHYSNEHGNNRATFGKYSSNNLAIFKKYSSADFEDLVGREWICRAWTFQEIILACNPVIVCGTRSISWDDFIRGITFLESAFDKGHWHGLNKPRNLPPQLRTWLSLFHLWMHMERGTHWNEKEIRKAVTPHPLRDTFKAGDGGPSSVASSSFYAYQHVAKETIVRRITLIIYYMPLFLSVVSTIISTIWVLKSVLTTESFSTTRIVVYCVILMILVPLFVFFFPFTRYYRREIFILGLEKGTIAKSDMTMMEGVLRAMRTRNVKDSRDRAYAFYGVLKALGADLTEPNYGNSARQVYQDFFIYLLKSMENLNLLLDAGSPGYPGIPSWVPHWDDLGRRSWIDSESIYSWRTRPHRPDLTPHYVIRGPLLMIHASFQGGKIAFCSDSLHNVTDIWTRANDHLWNIRVLKQWIMKVRQDARILQGNESISGCIYEVLHAGKSRSAKRDQTEHFDKWYQIMNEACLAGENSEFSTRGVLDALARDSNAADYYVSRCAEISDGERIFFITSSGVVGTGPLSITVGDVIVCAENVSMPLVL